MRIKKYKSINSFFYYKLFGLTIIFGSIIGIYFLLTNGLRLSVEISFYTVLSITFLISSCIFALSQIEYKANFAIDKTYKTDSVLIKLSYSKISFILKLLILVTTIGNWYFVKSINLNEGLLIRTCSILIGLSASISTIPIWRYIINKKIEKNEE